ncbi:MAG TPA: ATP-grasp domain-containing protein [Longimicrobiales bacterium]
MASILVTDAEQRAALAAVRSLGRAGHEVSVCASREAPLAGASRYARRVATVPDPLGDAAGFVTALRRLVDEWGIDILLPFSEAALLAVLPARDAFAGIQIPFPDHERFARICDKPAVLEAARAVGIAVPAQWRLDAPPQRGALPEGMRFPLVLKPARSVIEGRAGRIKSSVVHVADADALRAALERMPPGAYPVLVQERIIGPGVGVFLLVWADEVLASFSHRRIREKPPSGGVSVYRESIRLDPALLDASRALLRRFGWEGVAMVEYKVERATGTPYLMEINGRFWGSLQLAIDAGVDFPGLLVAAAQGRRMQPVLSYREGVRSRWFWGDVDHLLARLRHSREELALPPDAPGIGRALIAFLAAFGAGSRDEVFRLDDPAPAVREAWNWLRGR